MSLHTELAAEAKAGPVIDTHEHIRPREPGAYDGLFALWEESYVAADFASAGMPSSVWEIAAEDEGRTWEQIRPYVERVENTAYYRSLVVACQELYGLSDPAITDDNWQAVSQAIRDRGGREDWPEQVFNRAGIRHALQDTYWDPLPEELPMGGTFLVRVMRINMFVVAPLRGMRDHNDNSPYDYEERFGIQVRSLADYLELFEAMLDWHLARGTVALKSALAYDRELFFHEVPRDEAERLWQADDRSPQAVTTLGDFIMHHILDRAQARHVPIQVHTGYLAGGGYLAGRDPKQLTNLFIKYPRLRFDLFHGGYPFTGELAFLGKHFPNVYVDLCWLPIISPSAARAYLHEWIEQVPINKILWGGDCGRADAAYGALRCGQEVVARVLAEKVQAGSMASEAAFRAVRKVFHDNAWELFFGLE